MTVELVEMSEEVFAAFRERLIHDYAADNVTAGRSRPDDATQEATAMIDEILPDGTSTADQYLYVLRESDDYGEVGSVWVTVRDSPTCRMLWVYDIYINESCRNRGYGKSALRRIDDKATELGVTKVGLHVFGHNVAALNLYERYGYETTSVTITREIQTPEKP